MRCPYCVSLAILDISIVSTLEKLASTGSYLLLDQETFDNLKLTDVKILGEVKEFILISTNNQ